MATNKYAEFDPQRPQIEPQNNPQFYQQQPPPPNMYYPASNPQNLPYPQSGFQQPHPQIEPIVQYQAPPPLSYGIPIDIRQNGFLFSSTSINSKKLSSDIPDNKNHGEPFLSELSKGGSNANRVRAGCGYMDECIDCGNGRLFSGVLSDPLLYRRVSGCPACLQ